jgi:apolipoprotein D and lipocalin family protein
MLPGFFGCLFVLLLWVSATQCGKNEREAPLLKTVDQVDLTRYQGLWYEVARIPNRFQRKCSKNTTALYALRSDGRIDVVNTCIQKDGRAAQAQGIARIVDAKSNAKLAVSFVRVFGISLFWGDYWIIGLSDDYQYALVGTPGRKYGWILSRQPSLPPAELEKAFATLREQGYDPNEFVMTPQDTVKK